MMIVLVVAAPTTCCKGVTLHLHRRQASPMIGLELAAVTDAEFGQQHVGRSAAKLLEQPYTGKHASNAAAKRALP